MFPRSLWLLAFGNTFHFADLLHCPYLIQLFPKRWITSCTQFHPSDGENVNLLSSVGELALFSHKGPLNKICPSALDIGRGELIICEALHSVSVNQSLISCCYSHTSLHYSSPKTLGHKTLYHSIIPISNDKTKKSRPQRLHGDPELETRTQMWSSNLPFCCLAHWDGKFTFIFTARAMCFK